MKKKNNNLKDLIARLQRFQDWRRGKIDFDDFELDTKQIGLDIDAAIGKLQDQSFFKCLKELKLKDGTTPAQFLWDYLFLTGISVKEFEKSLDKAIKNKDTGNCDAGCGCKH